MSELARRYFPKSKQRNAVSQLRRWISLNLALQKRLEELYYIPGQKILTPLQHAAIVEALGEPVGRGI